MHKFMSCVSLGLALLAGCVSQPPPVVAALQGEWEVTRSDEGKGHIFSELVGSRVAISGSRMAWMKDGKMVSKHVRLILDTFPQVIQMIPDVPHDGWARVGIISVSNGRIDMAINTFEAPRPNGFRYGEDGRELVELQRSHQE